ncbi:discoidin domain-containing protein [Streptomyces fumanus]|uniref:Uncharacterized protein n=1 Tax=Streptomyces fumanus TaxID=67302 RepID=A0A919AZD9_9ACTN|nr:discoidin domain-containing protein [Streptomyces fumanus]GHF34306.1 hypothetical protein GCM10018772_69940 [Streptomyces fumanus]
MRPYRTDRVIPMGRTIAVCLAGLICATPILTAPPASAGTGTSGTGTSGTVAAQAVSDPGADLTDNGGAISAQYEGGSSAEAHTALIDNDTATKYLTHHPTGWVQYRSPAPAAVDRYTITSANDAPDRDPSDWTLQGSMNGTDWSVLDTRVGQTFASRHQTRGFPVANSTAYPYYRLVVSRNGGSPALQMAEWQLWSGGDGVPKAPTALTASAVGNEVDLAWTDNASDDTGYSETGYRIERSTDGTTFTPLVTVGANISSYTDSGLSTGSTYHYRLRAVGTGNVLSDYSNTARILIDPASEPIDITDLAGTVSDQYGVTGSEGHDMAVDNSVYSKYRTRHTATWLQYASAARSVVTGYALVSANDAQDRDPRSWTLRASTDGTTWAVLDTRADESFTDRGQRKRYTFANKVPYRYFRLDVTANNGSSSTQFAEWEILGTGSTTSDIPLPEAPSALTATVPAGDQIVLSWTDNSRWESAYRLERSTDGTDWNWSRTLPVGTTRYTDLGLSGNTTYVYRLRAENTAGASAYTKPLPVTTPSAEFPATWQEDWLDHTELLTQVHTDADVSIYFDKDMDRSQTWMNSYVTNLWKYTKQTYGGFGNARLAAIFHQNKYRGGHMATAFDPAHHYRNVIDLGLSNWAENDPTTRDVTSHEMAHIVEFSANGMSGSPAFDLWGDSKWAEIFQYDAYLGTGRTADAERFYNNAINKTDSFPRAGTAWFKNWFFPIWRDHGRGKVLNAFFTLQSAHFAQHNGVYVRDMNMGEFVHFWSGAAGVDLKARATTAFGWPSEYEAQLRQARLDYPDITYASAAA